MKDSCQARLDSSKFIPNLKVADWKRTSENETDVAVQMMNYGPMSVALNAELLQFYHKGVFDPIMCDKTALNHAVLLVGWGVENSKIHGQRPYWIVKNSWGTKWGTFEIFLTYHPNKILIKCSSLFLFILKVNPAISEY